MIIDIWMPHATLRFRAHEMFESLRRWTGQEVPDEELPIALTVAAMDKSGIDHGLLSAWHAPEGFLISNDEVAGWVQAHPARFGGVAPVDLRKPMQGVRELRRCVEELGFRAAGLAVAVGGGSDGPPLLPTVRGLRGARRPVLHAGRPHRSGCARQRWVVRSRTSTRSRSISRSSSSSAATSATRGRRKWSRSPASNQNVYIDTSAYTVRRYPAELVRYLQTGSGARKVLFGTNYPMLAHDQALEGLDKLRLDPETRANFLAGNAERLLRLKLPISP